MIVIDSITHEWDGKGGCLESNDLIAATRFKGNTWSAWSVTTPRHQKFIDAIVSSKCHIITTARSKTETIQTDDKKIRKVGTKEIQREGFEYELTINFTLNRDNHLATASKDRTELFEGTDPFLVTPEIGRLILPWTSQGIETGKMATGGTITTGITAPLLEPPLPRSFPNPGTRIQRRDKALLLR